MLRTKSDGVKPLIRMKSDGVKPLITTPYMTKFEKARILGTRALQLEKGAPSLIETDEIDSLIIAELELEAKVIPIIIQRPLPNGVIEEWSIKDMILPH